MVTSLGAAVDQVNRLVRKGVRQEWKTPKPRPKPKTWKGKKVISVEEWKKKELEKTEWRKFFPDRFFQPPFTVKSDDKQIIQYQETWLKEFLDFMKTYQDPDLGRWRCESCIFHPDPKPLSTSIRDAIVSTMRYDNQRPMKFPCKIVNVFSCPFDRRLESWQRYLDRGWNWEQVDNALKYAMGLTEHKQSSFIVDFEKKTVKQYHDDGQWLEHYNLDILAKIQFPRVPIKDHDDLCKVITNRDLLSTVLEQFTEYLESDMASEKNQELASVLRANLQSILALFSRIKDKVKLEELIDPYGRTIQDAKDDDMMILRDGVKYALPICGMSGACTSCNEFSNIRCVSCNVWLCLNHWRDHGMQAHNYKKPEE